MPPSSMMPVAMLSATSLVRFFIICFPQFLPLLAISPYPLQFSGLGTRVSVAYQREVRFSTLKPFHFNIHKFSKTIFTAKKMIFVVMHCGQHIGCYIVFPVFLILQTKLLGQMLYYVLTTGSGQQTLGEEYCDITQVSTHYLLSSYS